MKAKYFTVNESATTDSDFGHVGIIVAANSEELRQKLTIALSGHFGFDTEVGDFDLSRCFSKFSPINVPFSNEDICGLIEVRQSWIY